MNPHRDMADTPTLTVILPPAGSIQVATDFIVRNSSSSTRTANGPVSYVDDESEGDNIPPPKADFSAPPPYDVATNSKLPSYEEVQREKRLQGEEDAPRGLPHSNQPPTFTYVTVEPTDGPADITDPENNLLGTDFMFVTAFFVAFMFNWIGFLVLMCFCHTIASRYGALSGFGLSLAKWTLIVKHSTELASHDNSWLWWLIMAFGVLICIRAIVQYLNIKRGWRLLSGTAQERLLFFY